jgi:molybdopterin biosynthesis enzyme MoaB
MNARTILAAALLLATAPALADTLTISTPAALLVYEGTLDALSTNVRRVDFSAEDASAARAPQRRAPKAGPLLDGVTVSVRSGGGTGFAGSDCTLDAVDALAGSAHVYVTCAQSD